MPKTHGEAPSPTPSRFPEVPPPPQYPSGDYTYILEIVVGMQVNMGKLTEAVETLKNESGKLRTKAEEVSKDLHEVKLTLRIATAIMVAFIAGIGWGVNKAIDVAVKVYQPPTVQQQLPPLAPPVVRP